MDSSDESGREEPAPLNILEYTFSEKMLFVDTTQIKKFKKVYGAIQRKDIRPFVQLTLSEMENRVPKVGGVPNIAEFVAIRSLVMILYREATLAEKHKPPNEEIYKYLLSINLKPECCRELLNCLLTPDIFVNVPKQIRTFPHILSLRYMIDTSKCKSDMSNFRTYSEDCPAVSFNEYLREAIRIIIFLKLSNGESKAFSMKWNELANFRLMISDALRSAEEADENVYETEKTHRENMRMILAEGRL